MGVNGEALQLHTVYKELYFLLQVTRESISALQVMREIRIRLLPLALLLVLRTRSNTDGNNFSGIAL